MGPIARVNESESRYEIYFDPDHLKDDNNKGELYFGVVMLQVCECCCMWSEVDSVWGIKAENPQEALNHFRKAYEL